jgi:hypothetical protein
MNLVVWMGSYNDSIAQGLSEYDAVVKADSDVRETQSSMAPEDASAIEMQTPMMKTLMMFFGFFNNMANFYTSEWAKTAGGSDKALKRGMIAGNYVLFAVLGRAIVDSMYGRLGDDDDDDKEPTVAALEYTFGSVFDLTAPAFGWGGQLAQVTRKRLMNESTYGSRVSVSPVIENTDKLLDAMVRWDSLGEKQKVKNAMTLISYTPLLSFAPIRALDPAIPALQASAGYAGLLGAMRRPVGYAVDVQTGAQNPENALDVTQGILTGKGDGNP